MESRKLSTGTRRIHAAFSTLSTDSGLPFGEETCHFPRRREEPYRYIAALVANDRNLRGSPERTGAVHEGPSELLR
jgi:hypothetical protein